MSDSQMFPARVRAVLGPTNTGKTHLAMVRLLAHGSGIIGFPLRLLARENYDRMVAEKGEKHVALITGEEKIIPPEAKWFACTVEAMPLDRKVEFVAVDEIQLCADPDRGHIFTDRLLHARGTVETMFLGAETIRPLLTRLVREAEIETRPRLSQLTYTGPAKLSRLPARSAVVAFSGAEVYAIAEAIRRRRGGCAVVMGRLSPRTRNAQVALYQNREVDFLVATDAIGMGLNMDVDHVAFASLQKFDGHALRSLNAQEAAQIAGRAGRGMRDGTFGVTADCMPMAEDMVAKIETHSFEPLTTLAWRNSDLNFTSPDALLASLSAWPHQGGLARGNEATDQITLTALAREEEIRGLADSRARVQALWEACQVPDFRKLADDTHTRLCGRIFTSLAREGKLPTDWVRGQIAQLARADGDLDTLMARLAHIRVWSYIAARPDWLAESLALQAEARAAEDAVSDALHESLTARFVDRRAAQLIRKLDDAEEELLSAVTRHGGVVVEGHPVGQIDGFQFQPDESASNEDERKLVLRAARRALREEMPRRVGALEGAVDSAFGFTTTHGITWDGAEVARLKTGSEITKPQIEVIQSEFLDQPQRERIRARLARWLEAEITAAMAPLAKAEAKAETEGALRAQTYALREALGVLPGATEGKVAPELRNTLKTIGIRAGRFALYLPDMLKPKPTALRAQLWALAHDLPVPALPVPGLVSILLEPPAPETPPSGWPGGFASAMGWLPAGHLLLRLDVAERIAAELGFLTRRAPAPLPPDVASRLGIKGEALEAVLAALGFRMLVPPALEEGVYGPPAPTRVALSRLMQRGNHPRGNNRRPQRDRRDGGRDAAAAQGEGAEGNTAEALAAGQETPAEGAQEQRGPRPQRHRGGQKRHGQGGQRPPREGQAQGQEAGAQGAGDNRRGGPRPQGDRPQGDRHQGDRPQGDRNGKKFGPPGGGKWGKRDGRGDSGRNGPPQPRQVFGAPPRKEREPDPDSPFAVLAKLKMRQD